MASDDSEANQKAALTTQSKNQHNDGPARVVSAGNIEQVGDRIAGDKVAGDKISGDVVITGEIAGDVQVTYVQRAPVAPPPPPLQPPAADFFVGREKELAFYESTLDQAGIAVISGMAGVGKTALASVLARRIARPENIFWYSFHEGEGVDGLIWRLAGFLATHGQEDLWALLQNALQTNSRPPPPEVLFDYLVEQFRRRGFLLCLDDFQYADDNPLLNQLVERIRPLLPAGELQLIITSREVPDFVRLVSFDALEGLSIDDLRHMLAASDLYLEEEQIERLHNYTAGNAQMLTLAIDLLLSGYEADELLDELVVTDDLEDFLMDEIESRLTRNERLAMSAVAVLQGYPGSRAAVEAVLDGRRLRRVLRDLSDRFLLTVSRVEGERLYNQHAIVRDFFYDSLNQRERSRMHLRAAGYYRDEEPDTVLAIRHFLLGGNHHEAAVLAEENVYRLLSQGQATALDSLLGQIERGQLATRQWIGVRLVTGQVNSFLGQNDEAKGNYLDALNELRTMPESPETAELYARICLGMADLLKNQSPQEALAWADRGLGADTAVADATRAQLFILHGFLQLLMGDFVLARRNFEDGLALSGDGPNQIRGRALKNLVSLSFYSGRFDEGKQYAEEALAISRQLHDRFEESSILSSYAAIQFTSGEIRHAITSFREALDIARQQGNRNYIIDFALNLSNVLIITGAYAEAHELLREAFELAQQLGHELSMMTIHLHLATLHLHKQAWDEAEAELNLAEKLAHRLAVDTDLPAIYSTWAEAAIGRQQFDRALQFAQQAQSFAQESGDPYEFGIACRARGLAAQASGDLAEAERCFNESLQALQDLDPFECARTQLALGSLLAIKGDGREAWVLLATAREAFENLGADPFLFEATKALATLGTSSDKEESF